MLNNKKLTKVLVFILILTVFFAIYVQIQFRSYLVINRIKKISTKIEKIRDENIQFEKDTYQKKIDKQWLQKKYLERGYKKINFDNIPTIIFTNRK